jgi:uncharacterized RmlC-like cupin family protein
MADPRPYVVRSHELSGETAQTAGMQRDVAIGPAVGAQRVWLGRMVAEPHTRSAKHHHGEAETASWIISGTVRVYFGEDYEEYVEMGPGDFLYVPAHIPHIEANPGDEQAIAIVCRSPDNIVVPLEDE